MNPHKEFAQRVKNIQVLHPQMESIFKIMDSHMKRPGKTRHLFVTGSSNIGKTKLAEIYLKKYPEYVITEPDETEITVKHVIYMETPHPFTLMEFYHELLDALGSPRLKGVPKINDLKTRAYYLMKRQEVKMVIIDEVNNILTSGFNASKAMDTIKQMANKTKVTLVLMGTPEAIKLRELDDQYKSRYRPKSLNRFEKCDDEFCRLLEEIETYLAPPQRIGLGDLNLKYPQLLHLFCKGKLGFLIPIIQEAYDILGLFNEECNDISNLRLSPKVIKEAFEIIQGDKFDDNLTF
ncbi:TniB family NTP-binding protein [Fictibacillus phosphorivorans]|uniref:TniB family NTP-binding protein n=1 Tax=Fictibacillus phosphorivorans TaxID=1221500 RepID=UPI00203AC533|nr:TniB family NTP-binding protein [Fictibacillus phosphorivorans]MCM3719431.1 TniB family NTP-binding protein [Fictibacillus phosphorivorans]MCM3777091.1 TniB family NTP-binding protein [Fictibacillus phosphorivorans]